MEINEYTFRRPVPCPWCKVPLKELGTIHDTAKPRGGDVILCVNCGKFSLMVGISEMRKPTHEEMSQLIETPLIVALYMAWKQSKST